MKDPHELLETLQNLKTDPVALEAIGGFIMAHARVAITESVGDAIIGLAVSMLIGQAAGASQTGSSRYGNGEDTGIFVVNRNPDLYAQYLSIYEQAKIDAEFVDDNQEGVIKQ